MSAFPKKTDVRLSSTYLENRISCIHFLKQIKSLGGRFLTNGKNLSLTEASRRRLVRFWVAFRSTYPDSLAPRERQELIKPK
jgi:hypothetical protein